MSTGSNPVKKAKLTTKRQKNMLRAKAMYLDRLADAKLEKAKAQKAAAAEFMRRVGAEV
jgi:hypothetical protein